MNWTKEEKEAAETAIFKELRKWDQVSSPSAMAPALRRAVALAVSRRKAMKCPHCNGEISEQTNGDDHSPMGVGRSIASTSLHFERDGSGRSPVDCAIDEWNIRAKKWGWPVVQERIPKRTKAVAARLTRLGGLSGWDAMLEKAEASAFIRENKMHGWCLDWVIKPGNLAKLMEGNYDGKLANGSSNGSGELAAFARGSAAVRNKVYRGL